MNPETEQLLHQCRAALLQQNNEQLNTLFASWFERMIGEIGEGSMDEALDDLCLLLGYGIRSLHSDILYTTYTSWWEVEGFAGHDGEFVCRDGAALQHRLITMPIKQFALVAELAYQVCVLDAEVEGQPRPPTGQEWLRSLAAWLGAGAPHTTPPAPQQQLSRKQRRAQRRRLAQELVQQAWQCGYLLLGPDVSTQVPILVQSRCKKNRRPYISVKLWGERFACIRIELCTVHKAFEAEGKLFREAPLPAFTPTDEIQQRLTSFAAHYSTRAGTGHQETFGLALQRDVFELKQILQADVPRAVEDFMALWPNILAYYEAQLEARRATDLERQRQVEEALARYEAQLEARRLADLERQRQVEEARTAWLKTLTRLSAQEQAATCPELDERVVLPAERVARLSKKQLGAFLTFFQVPAGAREMKANLVQHLLTRLEVDKLAKAQFFEVFAFELAVPPWELETLLGCTTTERKRWTEELKLPILGYDSFRKAGSDHAYPVYDRRVILALAGSDIETWRREHQALARAAPSCCSRGSGC